MDAAEAFGKFLKGLQSKRAEPDVIVTVSCRRCGAETRAEQMSVTRGRATCSMCEDKLSANRVLPVERKRSSYDPLSSF